jgi:hypothetical protein
MEKQKAKNNKQVNEHNNVALGVYALGSIISFIGGLIVYRSFYNDPERFKEKLERELEKSKLIQLIDRNKDGIIDVDEEFDFFGRLLSFDRKDRDIPEKEDKTYEIQYLIDGNANEFLPSRLKTAEIKSLINAYKTP